MRCRKQSLNMLRNPLKKFLVLMILTTMENMYYCTAVTSRKFNHRLSDFVGDFIQQTLSRRAYSWTILTALCNVASQLNAPPGTVPEHDIVRKSRSSPRKQSALHSPLVGTNASPLPYLLRQNYIASTVKLHQIQRQARPRRDCLLPS